MKMFLVIGAMKSGTTTLSDDLRKQDGIWLPVEKELNNLCYDKVLEDRSRERYLKKLVSRKKCEFVGEASTRYSMLPDWPGVPERAKATFGEKLKLVYIVRDPLKRMESHWRHEMQYGRVSESGDRAVIEASRLIRYSCYDEQLRPWVRVFGKNSIKVIKFEEYRDDRDRVVADILRFLDPNLKLTSPAVSVANQSSGKPIADGSMEGLITSAAYRNVIRNFLPRGIRKLACQVLLRKGEFAEMMLSDATLRSVLSQFESGHHYLAENFHIDTSNWARS